MDPTLIEHYRRLAKNYDEYLYYSDEFVRSLTRKMIAMLRLREDDRLVDLGCGTGMYSLDILRQMPLKHRVVGVDPFPEMLAAIPEDAPVDTVAEGALEYSERPGSYDKVLMKEAVHHVEDRKRLFANLYERLTPGGVLLLVHVPPKLSYPIFEAALRRSEQWLADPDRLGEQLRAAGFQVERDGLDYRHVLPKEYYFDMVGGRYMSVLSTFSDEEISDGLREMEQTYADQDVLEFNDHFDYLAAVKPA